MQTTGNLGLKKPEGTDIVDISDLNGNMDILDNVVNGKVDKVTGKQLSTNDYTTAEKTKLAGIATGANNYTHPNHTGDVTSNGDGITAIAAGVIVNADVNAAAGIDASKIGTGVVSNTEFGYLDGVTSGIQSQFNARPLLTTTPQQTTADITYYVRTDGNDNNNGLANAAAGAFKTIQKAICMLPQIINHIVVINVAAGSYAEEVEVKGFSGKGGISIQGGSDLSASTNYKVKNAVVKSNSVRISFTGIEFTAADSVKSASMCIIDNPGYTEFVYCRSVFTNKNNSGIFVSTSPATVAYICEISNKQYAVFCTYSGAISVQNFTGSGNDIRFRATAGGNISVVGSSSTGGDMATDGAIIAPNSGVLNPWGDNTTSQRSFVSVGALTNQNVLGSVNTKIEFQTKISDNLSEYTPSLSRFTAKSEGVYNIAATVSFSNVPDSTRLILNLYLNGSLTYRLYDSSIRTVIVPGVDTTLAGSTSLYLNAGDYIEIYTYIGFGVTGYAGLDSAAALRNLRIVRIA